VARPKDLDATLALADHRISKFVVKPPPDAAFLQFQSYRIGVSHFRKRQRAPGAEINAGETEAPDQSGLAAQPGRATIQTMASAANQ